MQDVIGWVGTITRFDLASFVAAECVVSTNYLTKVRMAVIGPILVNMGFVVAWIAADRFRPGDKRVGPRILYAEPRVSLRASY